MQGIPADHRAAQVHERLVRIVTPLVTRPQAAVLVQPRQRSLHDPAEYAKPTAMGRATLGQHWLDTPMAELATVGLRVVSPVALQAARPGARMADFASHC